MKGLIKQLIMIAGIMFILYLIFTKTPLLNYIGTSISGFFTSIFSDKTKKTLFFEFLLDRNSSYEIAGIFNLKVVGIVKDFEINKISGLKFSKNASEINLVCIENCLFKFFSNNLEVKGKVSNLNIEDFKFYGSENLDVRISVEKIEKIEADFRSKSLEVCLTNAIVSISYETHKMEQKIYSDCIRIDDIVRIVFNFENGKTLISGYANKFKSTFFSNYG